LINLQAQIGHFVDRCVEHCGHFRQKPFDPSRFTRMRSRVYAKLAELTFRALLAGGASEIELALA
jgi:hypothetical protein